MRPACGLWYCRGPNAQEQVGLLATNVSPKESFHAAHFLRAVVNFLVAPTCSKHAAVFGVVIAARQKLHCLLPSTRCQRWLLQWLPVLCTTKHTAPGHAECVLLQVCFSETSSRIYLLDSLCFLSVVVVGCIVDHPVRFKDAWSNIVRIVCMHQMTCCPQPAGWPQQCQYRILIVKVKFLLQPGEPCLHRTECSCGWHA